MQNRAIKPWFESSWLTSANLSYIEKIYKGFLDDPNSVDAVWRNMFYQFSDVYLKSEQFHFSKYDYSHRLKKDTFFCFSPIRDLNYCVKQIKVLQLIEAYRFYGYRNANLDPLGFLQHETIPDLDPSFYGLKKEDYQKKFFIGSFGVDKNHLQLGELIDALKKIYCSTIGVEYMHINSTDEKYWIQQRIESAAGYDTFSIKEKKEFLKELTAAEGLERYLGAKFPGMKRFSLEGGDVLVPMLREIIRHAAKKCTKEVIIGMTHRGRLNVLVNVLGKMPQDLFDEFYEKNKEKYSSAGDVKYHMGFSSNVEIEGGIVHLSLAFNPSHLEIISPVVMGSVRARLDRLDSSSSNKILPITIHGDAAVIGQGVVQETLNMSQVRGYEVGGTVHIVINNQIGFTTSNPKDARSTQYCTDIGKMVQSPIFHVNSSDPEAVAFVSRLALDFRNTFKRDIFIDLVCYRRHGHNESEDPSVTQPIMYQKIKKLPTPRKIYADRLEIEKIINLEDAMEMIKLYRDTLDARKCIVPELRPMGLRAFTWSGYRNHKWDEKYPEKVDVKYLQNLAKYISQVPKLIEVQSLVAKIYKDRAEMAEGRKPFDWGAAENLSYATLLDKGISVRISGEDSSRGTFFHRHAVIYNQVNGSTYIPLQHIHDNQGQFKIWDSVLSEEAVLAFEYGYATTAEPRTLTIWEAQFGDFANGAQVVIDQFISSGEQKWGQMCGLVMLLPHGYEGQGPEHSSARLERYLQLCAERNMQVCVPSTPAQLYHVLRRQALRVIRRPLVLISPKSLLRHPLVVSSLEELANGYFHQAIGEVNSLDMRKVKRVILCSGKVYYDLLEQRRENKQNNVAIVRIEQLYPFPYQTLQKILQSYMHVCDFVWCQEEPQNQGAWYYSQSRFRKVVSFGASLRYVGRPASASPAVGCMSVHLKQQKDLINDALNFD